MDRRKLQKIILEELMGVRSTSRPRPRRLKLRDYLDESSDHHLLSIDDDVIISTGKTFHELNEMDIGDSLLGTYGDYAGEAEEGSPAADVATASAPTTAVSAPAAAASTPEPTSDPEDDIMKAAREPEAASKAREEEMAVRASVSAPPTPAGSAPAPASGTPAPDPLTSIASHGAEEERKKRGKEGTAPVKPTTGEEPSRADVDEVPVGGSGADSTDSDGPGEPEEEEETPVKSNARLATQFIDDAISNYIDPKPSAVSERFSRNRYRL